MNKREFQSSPKGTIQTAHGEFKVTATSATTLYVETPDGGMDVRGVPVRGTEHWNLDEVGNWKGYHEGKGSQRSFTAQRLDRGQFVHADATATQARVAYEALRAAAVAFADANPALMLQAEAAYANNGIERDDKDIAKLQAELDKHLASRAAYMEREASALERLAELDAEAAPGMR